MEAVGGFGVTDEDVESTRQVVKGNLEAPTGSTSYSDAHYQRIASVTSHCSKRDVGTCS